MKLFVAVVMLVSVSLVGDWQEVKDWKPLLLKGSVKYTSGSDVTQPQNQSQQQRQGTNYVAPLINDHPQSSSSKSGADQPSDEVKKESRDTEWWMAAFTGGLLVVGLLQVVLIIFQAIYGWRAADAAKESARVARDALDVVERPSLAPEKWEFDIHGNANAPVDGIVCTLRNTGRTRATIIEGGISFDCLEKTPPRNEMPDLWLPQKGPFTVHPQEVLPYVLSFSEDEHKQIRRMGGSRERMYYYGRISYTDEFNNFHCLRFCIVENDELIPVKEGGYNYTETIKKQEEKQPTWYERIFRKRPQ